jgi:hypothetical protein
VATGEIHQYLCNKLALLPATLQQLLLLLEGVQKHLGFGRCQHYLPTINKIVGKHLEWVAFELQRPNKNKKERLKVWISPVPHVLFYFYQTI